MEGGFVRLVVRSARLLDLVPSFVRSRWGCFVAWFWYGIGLDVDVDVGMNVSSSILLDWIVSDCLVIPPHGQPVAMAESWRTPEPTRLVRLWTTLPDLWLAQHIARPHPSHSPPLPTSRRLRHGNLRRPTRFRHSCRSYRSAFRFPTSRSPARLIPRHPDTGLLAYSVRFVRSTTIDGWWTVQSLAHHSSRSTHTHLGGCFSFCICI